MSRGTAATPTRARAEFYEEWIGSDTPGSSDAPQTEPHRSSATPVSVRKNSMTSHLVPLAIMAAFAGGYPLRMRRHIWTNARTPVEAISWEFAEEPWEPQTMLITNDQVRALNALLAVPYTEDHGFSYFADE